MDALLSRYLDGDLGESEVRVFLDAVENDPQLERELRSYEALLALGRSLESPRVSPGFTDRVMDAVAAEPVPLREPSARQHRSVSPRSSRPRALPWAVALATAAAVTFAFLGGLRIGRSQDAPASGAGPVPFVQSASTSGPTSFPVLHVVRLVYVPQDPGVQRVTVAGSFNEWDPGATPLRQVDGTWGTTLYLPTGTYEYMFVEDGEHWATDPLAPIRRDDGFGGMNAVLDVGV